MSKKRKNPQAKRAAIKRKENALLAKEKAATAKKQKIALHQEHMALFFEKIVSIKEQEGLSWKLLKWLSATELFYTEDHWEVAFFERLEDFLTEDEYADLPSGPKGDINFEKENAYFVECEVELCKLAGLDPAEHLEQ